MGRLRKYGVKSEASSQTGGSVYSTSWDSYVRLPAFIEGFKDAYNQRSFNDSKPLHDAIPYENGRYAASFLIYCLNAKNHDRINVEHGTKLKSEIYDFCKKTTSHWYIKP